MSSIAALGWKLALVGLLTTFLPPANGLARQKDAGPHIRVSHKTSSESSGQRSSLFHSSGGLKINSIACMTTSHCLAVGEMAGTGGYILETTNSGTTWSQLQSFSGQLGPFSSIACPSALDCVVVGSSASTPTPVSLSEQLETGAQAIYTTNAGQSWQPSQGLPGSSELNSVSCPDSNVCWAVGTEYSNSISNSSYGLVEYSNNSGASWSEQAQGTFGSLNSISCNDSSTCIAAGTIYPTQSGSFPYQLFETSNAGVSWQVDGSQYTGGSLGSSELNSIYCPSSTACWAGGYSGSIDLGNYPYLELTTNGGNTWSNAPSSPFGSSSNGTINSISCVSPTTCWVAGQSGSMAAIAYTLDGGSSWNQSTLQTSTSQRSTGASALVCQPGTGCLGTVTYDQSLGANGIADLPQVSSSYLAYSAFGTTWSNTYQGEPSTPEISSIACPSASECFATGQNSSPIMATQNGGSSWYVTMSPYLNQTVLDSISCSSTQDCVALGYYGFYTTNGGFGWSPASGLPGRTVVDVSCTSSGMCLSLIGASIYESQDSGKSWQALAPGPIPDNSILQSVSCVNSQDCLVTGIVPTTSSPQPIAGTLEVFSTTDAGSSWVTQSVPSTFQATQTAVSCTSPAQCWLLDSNGDGISSIYVTTDSGSSWDPDNSGLPTQLSLNSISCVLQTTGSACWSAGQIGLDNSIYQLTSTSSSWTPVPGSSQVIGRVDSVTCVSNSYCVVGGSSDSGGFILSSLDQGYWAVSASGQVDSFGNAALYGSLQGINLAKPVVGMARTPDGGGYWLVASDGGVFTFGDANFYGSTGGLDLAKPVVGMASTPDGGGYWLVAADGGVFTFGDANFYGTPSPEAGVVAIMPSIDGKGYLLASQEGNIWAYGDANFSGIYGEIPMAAPVVAAISNLAGTGFWMIDSSGDVANYGTSLDLGQATGEFGFSPPVVGLAPN